eukprot:gene17191-biopygen11368
MMGITEKPATDTISDPKGTVPMPTVPCYGNADPIRSGGCRSHAASAHALVGSTPSKAASGQDLIVDSLCSPSACSYWRASAARSRRRDVQPV